MVRFPMTEKDQTLDSPPVSNRLRWAVLIPAMLLPVLGAYLYFDLWHGTYIANFLYQGTKLFTIVFPIICSVWILKTGLPFRRSPNSHHLRAIPAGIALGAAIMGVTFLVLKSPIGQ